MTDFFREPQAFDILAEKVLAPLVLHKATNASIRVWIPGCGCGEEPYSIAMLLIEQLMAAQKAYALQIFATDLDEQTLGMARKGIYPEHIAADVSRERLHRFFNKNEQTYQVNGQLRKAVVFAVQNPIKDPPFLKMDLICYRKLPIDLQPSEQRSLIELFHYALTKDGCLFLDRTENLDHQNKLFEPISKRWGIFRKLEPKQHNEVNFPALAGWSKPREWQVPTQPPTLDPPRLRELIQQQLQDYAPASVLINREGQILYYYGPIDRYLKPPIGIPNDDLMARVRKGLSTKILAALNNSMRDDVPMTLDGGIVQRNDTYCRVQVTVKPVKAKNAEAGMILVIFEDESQLPTSVKQDPPASVAQTLLVQQLETELEMVQKMQQATIIGQKSDNEELMFANEEIRTMNEELEASKAELQSLNRKLFTSNNQLQDKMSELEKAYDDLDNLLNGNDIATIFLDTQFRIKRFTPTTTELVNLISTDVGRSISDLSGALHDEDMLEDAKCVQDQLTPRDKEIHTENHTYIRRIVPYHTRDNRIDGVVITFINITEQRRIAQKMAYQAAHDALTGLANRREFERLLERILETAKAHQTENVLCYLDLDQFKVVNDTCGHIAGDELLRQISGVLQTHIRKRDTLARLGGDEFGILMEHCTLNGGRRTVNELRNAIGDYRFLWEGKSFGVGASMGMVSINAGSGSTSEILRLADAACYVAKEKGRNRIHIFNEKDSEVAKRHGEMQWITRIHSALEEDRFHLNYQPISPTNLLNDQERRYELLLRMQDKDGRIILPGAFLPAAERYALSSRLDRWVIQAAFAWLKTHPRHLQHLDLCSINLSALSLGNEEFLEFVNTRIKEDQLPPHKICFEITETAAITHLSTAICFIRELKGQGCHFALDDFGSGLCSFAYLKNLPVDYLKIDGTFVKDIVDDPIDLAMVKSINDVGKLLGLQTVAEFVENPAILEKLQALEVNYVQGYTIAPPKPLGKMGNPI
jgi:diguanylate cyclase (GGDEF)-like protein